MFDTFALYVALWRRAEAEDVWVHYDGWDGHGMSGYFNARQNEQLSPMIAITRPYYIEPMEEPRRESNAPSSEPQPNIERELVTLAHEYGHFRSFAGRTARDKWLEYDAVAHERSAISDELDEELPDGLSPDDASDWHRTRLGARLGPDKCAAIVREETLAWTIGREVLAELGMTDFRYFDERARLGVHNHRYRLGLDPAWPEDVRGSAPTVE